MKLQTSKSAVLCIRCAHRDSSGCQCRTLVSDAHSDLCPQHHAQQKEKEKANVAEILFRDCQDFQTAQGINYSLRSLYWLIGQNRISTRRATVLAYITSLLLQTLPAIASEQKAGITYRPVLPEPDPTKKPS
jgi:hypothetical protein